MGLFKNFAAAESDIFTDLKVEQALLRLGSFSPKKRALGRGLEMGFVKAQSTSSSPAVVTLSDL